jgi:ElaB/YqjD/DUF883 family membrane-anchored ribosome-binding protein
MNDMTTTQRDKLMSDVKMVVEDADELMRITANQAGERAADATAHMQNRFKLAKQELARVQEAAIEKTKALGKTTDGYVHENPWKSIGLAAGVGVVVGLLVGRR